VNLSLRSAARLCGWFPTYDVDFGWYSVGITMMLEIAREAAEHGLQSVELGRGDEPYKKALASWSRQVAAGTVPATRPAAFARRIMWKAIREMKDLELHHPALHQRLPRNLARLAYR
jgi:CelD/BcsL family acetyltransferase involved in cellulose biosynthesis